MHVHRTYAIDGWTFEAHNNAERRSNGALDPKLYAVSMVMDDGSEPLGNVLKVGPNCFMAVPKAFINWTHTKEPRHLPGSYRTLRDAIADLAREWDRQNPSRSKAMGRPPLPQRVSNISMPSLVDRKAPPAHHRPKAIPRTGLVWIWERDAIPCTTRFRW